MLPLMVELGSVTGIHASKFAISYNSGGDATRVYIQNECQLPLWWGVPLECTFSNQPPMLAAGVRILHFPLFFHSPAIELGSGRCLYQLPYSQIYHQLRANSCGEPIWSTLVSISCFFGSSGVILGTAKLGYIRLGWVVLGLWGSGRYLVTSCSVGKFLELTFWSLTCDVTFGISGNNISCIRTLSFLRPLLGHWMRGRDHQHRLHRR